MKMTETSEFGESRNAAFEKLLPYLNSITICGRGELSTPGRLSAEAHKSSDRIAMHLSMVPVDLVVCAADDCCDLSAIIMTSQREKPIISPSLREAWLIQQPETGAEFVFILIKTRIEELIKIEMEKLQKKENELPEQAKKKHPVINATTPTAQVLLHAICDFFSKRNSEVVEFYLNMNETKAFACRIEFIDGGNCRFQLFS